MAPTSWLPSAETSSSGGRHTLCLKSCWREENDRGIGGLMMVQVLGHSSFWMLMYANLLDFADTLWVGPASWLPGQLMMLIHIPASNLHATPSGHWSFKHFQEMVPSSLGKPRSLSSQSIWAYPAGTMSPRSRIYHLSKGALRMSWTQPLAYCGSLGLRAEKWREIVHVGVSINGGLQRKILLKWMICGYPYFRKPSIWVVAPCIIVKYWARLHEGACNTITWRVKYGA